MASSGHVAFYPAFAQIEGRGVQVVKWENRSNGSSRPKNGPNLLFFSCPQRAQ